MLITTGTAFAQSSGAGSSTYGSGQKNTSGATGSSDRDTSRQQSASDSSTSGSSYNAGSSTYGSGTGSTTGSDRSSTTGSATGTGSSTDISSTDTTSSSTAAGAPTGRDNMSSSNKLGWGDRRFVTKAAEAGMAELQLAQLAAQQASNSEVKNFAQKLVEDHSKVNSELTSIAGKKNVKLDDDDGKDRAYKRLSKKSGSEFDQEFVEHMIDEHEKDVKMYEKAAREAKDPEIRSFASKHIGHLRDHLQRAESLRQTIMPTGRTDDDSSSRTSTIDTDTSATGTSTSGSSRTDSTTGSDSSRSDRSGSTGRGSSTDTHTSGSSSSGTTGTSSDSGSSTTPKRDGSR